jgi:hypothetical protein
MAFNFERFERVGGRYAAKASIRSNGSIGLSQGAILKYKLNTGDWFAVLFYDKEKQVIGIKRTLDGHDSGATKIVTRSVPGLNGQPSYTSFISAKSFFDFYGIQIPRVSRSYPLEWSNEHDMLLINLKQEVKEGDDIPF